jgi:DNA polymerase III alpha subunit (gram-positive type)
MTEILNPEVLAPLTPEQEAAAELSKAMQVVTRAKAVAIKTDDDYRAADSACAAIKGEIKKVEARRDELVRPLNTVVKKINAGFKDVTSALESALDAYRRPMTTFQAELARQRQEAEAAARRERERMEAEARTKAEAEMAAARKAREEAEAARAATENQEDPFAALLAEDEATAAEARANEQAEAARQSIRDMATIEVPVFVAPKVTGSASKVFTVYDFEVEDESKIPDPYWVLDRASLLRDVRAAKEECRIPGIKVTKKTEVK